MWSALSAVLPAYAKSFPCVSIGAIPYFFVHPSTIYELSPVADKQAAPTPSNTNGHPPPAWQTKGCSDRGTSMFLIIILPMHYVRDNIMQANGILHVYIHA